MAERIPRQQEIENLTAAVGEHPQPACPAGQERRRLAQGLSLDIKLDARRHIGCRGAGLADDRHFLIGQRGKARQMPPQRLIRLAVEFATPDEIRSHASPAFIADA